MSALDDAALAGVAPIVSEIRTIPNPAAGSDFSFTVPGGQAWEVYAVGGLLTTSAVVANRQPSLIIDDTTNTALQIAAGQAIPASFPSRFTWVPGVGGQSSTYGEAILVPLPGGIVVPAGWRVRSSTLLLDAGDTWTACTAWIRRADIGITALAVARNLVEQVYEHPAAYVLGKG